MGGIIWLEPLREFESRIRKALASSAKDLMTSKKLLTVSPEATVEQAAKLIAEHGHNRLPVVDADGLLVGVVTRVDVLSSLAG
jgi:CBS domain-containing protein